MKVTNFAYRMIALSMAFLIFFTSAGITLDLHYCQGKIKTFRFFGKAKNCFEVGKGMKDCPSHVKMQSSKKTRGSMVSKKGCCSNKTLHFQSDQDQQNQVETALVLSQQKKYFVLNFTGVFLDVSVLEKEEPSYAYCRPPLIPRDIYALLETYLI